MLKDENIRKQNLFRVCILLICPINRGNNNTIANPLKNCVPEIIHSYDTCIFNVREPNKVFPGIPARKKRFEQVHSCQLILRSLTD